MTTQSSAGSKPDALPPTSVVIVEDEVIAEDLRQMMTEQGFDVLGIAASADEALLLVKARCPDVVLVDVRIQGPQDGVDTARLLHEKFGVSVVFLTAHADPLTVERAKTAEPFGYLIKPFRPAELRSAIELAAYRNRMERRLRGRERWFSTTLRSIADAVIAVDLTGQVRFINAAAEALTGFAANQALGRPVREIVRLLDPHQPASPLDFVLSEKRTLSIAEAEMESAAGPRAIISDTVAPVLDGQEMLGAVMVFRDITQQKKAQHQLELADRLASLGAMAAGVAHEVNNPLTVVLANAAYVLEALESRQVVEKSEALAEQIEAQAQVHAAALRISRIVAELLSFARPSQPPTNGADVGPTIQWAVRASAQEMRSRARVIVDIEGAPRVSLDETRLGQVLLNLLINAAHAIQPGNVEANAVTVRARNAGSTVVIEVKDTGGGMPPEVLQRIFEPWFTTKPVGQGTGLGLAICHGIVTSAGGCLDVESEVGAGALFRLTLPAWTGDVVQSTVTEAPAASTRRGRILVVDDEPTILNVVKRILGRHEVVCLQDARQALRLLDSGERFDLILSDVMMPHMTGMAFYERLLADHPDLAPHVAFITGGATTPLVADFLAVVSNPQLAKPFGVRALESLVEAALANAPPRTD